MELVVLPVKGLLKGRVMTAEVDKLSTMNVAASVMGVFKDIDAVVFSRSGDAVLEYNKIV